MSKINFLDSIRERKATRFEGRINLSKIVIISNGITAGCGGGNYCPDQYLTRAQMAVFLTKAFLPPENRIVFVTSVSGNGNLSTWADAGGQTGILAGDNICKARAQSAGLENATNFKAWLSDSTTDARNHITSSGPWVRLDGVKVADDKADLTDGSLFTSINLNETMTYSSGGLVWTGTGSDGIKTAYNCNNWIDGSSSANSTYGVYSNTTSKWSDYSVALMSCNSPNLGLYCFED